MSCGELSEHDGDKVWVRTYLGIVSYRIVHKRYTYTYTGRHVITIMTEESALSEHKNIQHKDRVNVYTTTSSSSKTELYNEKTYLAFP